ncbi:discoidin domain-containing protein [Kribbella sp. NPDC056951]|uniref:discoidin domain-containing protein n=1 Tax=Kribbella sp. NPDC056951 TaxID=3345978 RepID=UPI00362C46D4
METVRKLATGMLGLALTAGLLVALESPVAATPPNLAPRKPAELNLRPPVSCGTATAPAIMGTTQPVFTAIASDPESNVLTTRLTIQRIGASTPDYELDSAITVSGVAFSWPTIPAGKLVANVAYAYSARSNDGTSNGPSTAKCHFMIDETPPGLPTIESSDYPDGEPAINAWTSGRVTLRPDPADGDVIQFRYGFQQDRLTGAVPVGPDGVAVVPVTLSPDPSTGIIGKRLYVAAVDRAGNPGPVSAAWSLQANPAPAPAKAHGDVDGDGRPDAIAVFDKGFDQTTVWNLVQGRDGRYDGVIGWDSGINGGYGLSRTRSVTGDFDGDGKTDVMLMRTETGQRLGLYLLKATGGAYEPRGQAVWRSSGEGWSLGTTRMLAGDLNADGRDEIVLQRDTFDGGWQAYVLSGAGGGQPASWLRTAPSSGQWAKSSPVIADLDGDGRKDLVTLDDRGGCRLRATFFRSTGTGFDAGTTKYDGSHCADRARSVAGDVTGDGQDDLVIPYDYGDTDLGVLVLRSGGPAVETWWRTPGLLEPAKAEYDVVDTTGDGRDDLVLVAARPDGGRDLKVLASTGTAFAAPQQVWTGASVHAETGPKADLEFRSYELVARHSRQCLQIRGRSRSLDAVLDQGECTGALHQRFQIDQLPGVEQYQFHPAHLDGVKDDGKSTCVDLGGSQESPGSPVLQQACDATSSQQFAIEYLDGFTKDAVVRLRNAHSGFCVGVENAGQAIGAAAVQQTCGNGADQQWILRPSRNSVQLDGRYRLSAVKGGRFLEAADCGTTDGADLRVWDPRGASACQQWMIHPLGQDAYQVVGAASGKALDVQGCSTDNLAVIHLWTSTPNDCQRWRIEPAADGSWSITQTMSGKSLDVAGCRPESGADLIIWPYWNGPCQRWRIDKVPENLAFGRTVTANSQEDVQYAAPKVADGNYGTRWASALEHDPEWISVDLGSVRTINKVSLVWEVAHARKYTIQLSDDGVTWRTVHTRTDGDGGTDNIDLTPTTARHVRMHGTERATEYGYSLYEFEVFAPDPNLALNRPTQSSSRETSDLGPANAVDGSIATRWASALEHDPEWISVDLGSLRSISKITLVWEFAYARAYQVQVSENGTTWQTVHTRTDGDGGTEIVRLAPTNARHVRLQGTERASGYGYSLYELEVT